MAYSISACPTKQPRTRPRNGSDCAFSRCCPAAATHGCRDRRLARVVRVCAFGRMPGWGRMHPRGCRHVRRSCARQDLGFRFGRWQGHHVHPPCRVDAHLETQGRHQPPGQTQAEMERHDDRTTDDHPTAFEQPRCHGHGRGAQDRRTQFPKRGGIRKVQGLDFPGLKSGRQRLLVHRLSILTI